MLCIYVLTRLLTGSGIPSSTEGIFLCRWTFPLLSQLGFPKPLPQGSKSYNDNNKLSLKEKLQNNYYWEMCTCLNLWRCGLQAIWYSITGYNDFNLRFFARMSVFRRLQYFISSYCASVYQNVTVFCFLLRSNLLFCFIFFSKM